LQVEWRDGSTSWLPLKQLKESNPLFRNFRNSRQRSPRY
jgi:hypothetical protein